MTKPDYKALLRLPAWQKKRLEIMERDRFECQDCGDTEKTLNVHHLYYVAGRAPWEYESESLITLCETCHEAEHASAYNDERRLINVLHSVGVRAGCMASDAYWIQETRKLFTPKDIRKILDAASMVVFLCSQEKSVAKSFLQFAATQSKSDARPNAYVLSEDEGG